MRLAATINAALSFNRIGLDFERSQDENCGSRMAAYIVGSQLRLLIKWS